MWFVADGAKRCRFRRPDAALFLGPSIAKQHGFVAGPAEMPTHQIQLKGAI